MPRPLPPIPLPLHVARAVVVAHMRWGEVRYLNKDKQVLVRRQEYAWVAYPEEAQEWANEANRAKNWPNVTWFTVSVSLIPVEAKNGAL